MTRASATTLRTSAAGSIARWSVDSRRVGMSSASTSISASFDSTTPCTSSVSQPRVARPRSASDTCVAAPPTFNRVMICRTPRGHRAVRSGQAGRRRRCRRAEPIFVGDTPSASLIARPSLPMSCPAPPGTERTDRSPRSPGIVHGSVPGMVCVGTSTYGPSPADLTSRGDTADQGYRNGGRWPS